ncbi:Uncharacterised protein [Pantoea agglomerans]|nr:hypothetical protein RN49_13215 [Pantoea agglomerans]MBA5702540.1 hypothetical protein [Pantoea agglomerans]SUB25434.1 Uncharacterised protein [Pantoea agglomerans]SUC48845.1 Uncharacterised protein [Pantoea agglomerans]
MRLLKITLLTLFGAVCGAGLMYLLMPLISRVFVGTIYGEDQMSQNFAIFLIGALVLAVLGAFSGWYFANKLIKPRQS